MGIRFTHPEWLWFLLTLIPLVLLYVYLSRRTSNVVPSLRIWRATQPSGNRLLNRPLRRLLEWLCASSFILSTVSLAAGIHFQDSDDQKRLMFFVDNSSSMMRPNDTGSDLSLLDKSMMKVREVLQNIPDDTRWRVYQLAPSPRLVNQGTGAITDPKLNSVSPAPLQASPVRIRRYLSALLPVSNSSTSVKPYLYSDRQVPGLPGILQQHSRLQIVPVGGPAENLAITDASLERRWDGQPETLHLHIQNFSDSARTFPVRLHGLSRQNRQTSIEAGGTRHLEIGVEAGTVQSGRLGAVMETADPFPMDNGTYFVRWMRRSIPVRIDLPAPSSRFVRSAINSAGSPFYVASPGSDAEPDSAEEQPEPIRIVEHPSETPPKPGRISFRSASDSDPDRPGLTSITATGASPLTSGLGFQELTVHHFSALEPKPHDTCLMSSEADCLALLGQPDGQRPYVQFGFALSDSNFNLLPEFPLLLSRLLHRLREVGRSNLAPDRRTFDGFPTDTDLMRTWLLPDGGLNQQRIGRPETSEGFLPPGWYSTSGSNEPPVRSTINFFHPDESNMNRRSPTVQQRVSASSKPVPANGSDSVPIRTTLLLIGLLAWIVFLLLTIY